MTGGTSSEGSFYGDTGFCSPQPKENDRSPGPSGCGSGDPAG